MGPLRAASAASALRRVARKERVQNQRRFFKTGPGQYGEGDYFLGATMPEIREVARCHRDLDLSEIRKLIISKYHEDRMLGFVILNLQYHRAKKDEERRQAIYQFYVKHRTCANNWDLVDVTAPGILGAWMWDHAKDRKRLHEWVKSKNLWERRLSILCTLAFIRRGHFDDTIRIAEKLLQDEHDLIHKATGWMMRECGKKDVAILRSFLSRHATEMPRTMLRYSIERLSPAERARWMAR